MKVLNGNLKALGIIVGIILALGAGFSFLYVSYDNAKDARGIAVSVAELVRTTSKDLEKRINIIETEQARFEGIMSERTMNIQDNVKTIKENIQTLMENLELSK